MNQTIECRSPQQIADDNLLAAHEMLTVSLNARSAGVLLFVGERRKRMQSLLETIEARIVSGDSTLHGPLSWQHLAHAAICL
jgi:hypothetical protein